MSAGWNFETTYTNLPRIFYRRLEPTRVPEPRLVLLHDGLARGLGLEPAALRRDAGVAVLAGNELPTGAEPIATAYAGHQFGGFTMLGDGRAILLGEHVTPTGERFDVQLKGAGPTPYSRGGDGRAALGPMLREFLVSEAMHGLNIPTTRSLAVVATGEAVIREKPLRGAVLTRIARSHLRVGTFQFAAAWHGPDAVRALADYAIGRHFSAESAGRGCDATRQRAADGAADTDPGRYRDFFRVVMEKQADLIARWQLVGFIHGVMNTDNMSICGETIDYGPCAFMDVYDPTTVFSSIDRDGRYAFERQPPIAQWNLARFAETLLPLLDEQQEKAIQWAQDAISAFPDMFRRRWLDGMRAKLGLRDEKPGDRALVDDLLDLMKRHKADYTNTFRALTVELGAEVDRAAGKGQTDCAKGDRAAGEVPADGGDGELMGIEALFASACWEEWRHRWRARLRQSFESSDFATDRTVDEATASVPRSDGFHRDAGLRAAQRLMRYSNPAIIARNHRVEEALKAAEQGDFDPVKTLFERLVDPFAYTEAQREYAAPPPASTIPYVTYCGT